MPDHIGFYSERAVAEISTLDRTTIWRMVKAGTFPSPVRISAGRVAWPRAAVEAWIREKMGAPDEKAA